MKEDRAFLEMLRPAAERLRGRDPARLAALCGCAYEGGELAIPSLGRTIRLAWPALEPRTPMENWMLLVLLHYLDLGDGTPVSGRLLPFGELREGLVRGGDMDRRLEARARLLLDSAGEERWRAALKSLGASFIESNADLTAVLPFLPRWLMTLKLWFPDEELPGSGRLFADASADRYLTVEDAVTAAELVWSELEKRL